MATPPGVYPNYSAQPQQMPLPAWAAMTPKVADHKEFEHELRGADVFLDWMQHHTHFFEAIFGKLEDLILEGQARFFFKAGLISLFRRNAEQAGIQETPEIKIGLTWAENLGRPNTMQDSTGQTVETKIVAGMSFTAETLHAEVDNGIQLLQDQAAHNHAVHVSQGWAYEDPRTGATWTQYGIHGPTQYDQYGQPLQESAQFQPHPQGYGSNLYGQPGHPPAPVHGIHSNTGHATSNLLGKLISVGSTVAAGAAVVA